jgi:AraC family transcriptional regulator, transcriptional activator of the genes for pyochelin and ferripyochelin receptors
MSGRFCLPWKVPVLLRLAERYGRIFENSLQLTVREFDMALVFSQDHYWTLLQQSLYSEQARDPDELFDTTWTYPDHLGQGYWRSIQLRPGLELVIADYHPHTPIVIECPDRHHSLEYEFLLPYQFCERSVAETENYFFSGSGLATRNRCYLSTDEQFLEVSVHIEPELSAHRCLVQ